MSENMNAVVGVIVDNCVIVTTLVALLVSILSVVILWTRKRQTSALDTPIDEFLVEDAQPRSKKAAKPKPKKTKADKVSLLCFTYGLQSHSDLVTLVSCCL